jgi:hypothetical protein
MRQQKPGASCVIHESRSLLQERRSAAIPRSEESIRLDVAHEKRAESGARSVES